MTANSATRPSLDDLDNYHVNLDDDPFRSPSPLRQNDTESKKRKSDGLGIDEEVDVTKRARVPRVKLDETRLLSDDGIPKLRKRAAGLKFKGKGHEVRRHSVLHYVPRPAVVVSFYHHHLDRHHHTVSHALVFILQFSDAARLLTFYQFWLDDLFPKAKFLDALAMVEKAGHKRVLVSKRAEWIDECKPRASDEADQDDNPLANAEAAEPAVPAVRSEPRPNHQNLRPAAENERTKRPQAAQPRDDNDDGIPDDEEDLYAATPRKNKPAPRRLVDDEEDDEDDLEALMAEADAGTRRQTETRPQAGTTDFADTGSLHPEPDRGPDDDEEAAMAEMEGLW
ncbi:Swi3-domain-containing protein [Sodiomyces alkalinus F11]|uniref:Chromosome segregation in meiosis protein n=1 Tax=Sodiomyces alkalinus (strain CBS 110278 / VKM F-3762 / F11) TaxID=1314773 RepID=A0A3N2PSM7_SODAK|nr:Swi3-domain-containing protein [Sodiomyces alkalinus F11]ROT37521.1 Swi3-domain-containing protein [Sodiomyces alkalinus F11]